MRPSFWGRAFCKKMGPNTPTYVSGDSMQARFKKLTNSACRENDKEQANSQTNVVITLANLAANWLFTFTFSNAVPGGG